jgi:hypothetical protein
MKMAKETEHGLAHMQQDRCSINRTRKEVSMTFLSKLK